VASESKPYASIRGAFISTQRIWAALQLVPLAKNPQSDNLGKQSPGRTRRAKCLVAFKANIDDSINKRIGTGGPRMTKLPIAIP